MISRYKLREFGCTQRAKDIMGRRTIVWGPRGGWVRAAVLYITMRIPASSTIINVKSTVLELHKVFQRDYV